MIDELDIEVHYVNEGKVLSKKSRLHDKLIHEIRVVLAKHYIDNLREETQKGMLQKAKQSIYPSHAPVGYINVTVEGKKLIAIDIE